MGRDWGQKIGFSFSALLPHFHNLIQTMDWTVVALYA